MTLALPAGAGRLPAVFHGMDRTDALAFVSRLFEAAEAGAEVWSDAELVSRFLASCSRSGSQETRSAYRLDLQCLADWIARDNPGLILRQFSPAHAQRYVDAMRERVEASEIARRTFNRRVSTVSALFRWASEPNRSGTSGIPRNPMPRRVLLDAPKVSRALSEAELSSVLGAIEAAARGGDRTAARDRVMLRGCYLIGCRVSELARLRWQDLEAVEGGGQVHLLGKGSKARVVRVSAETLALFESLGRGAPDAYLFPNRRGDGPMTRQAIAARCKRWGRAAGAHVHPHKLRHSHASHAVRRGIDAFTLQLTLGHASTATTAGYVAANPSDSSSLRLG